MTRTPQEAAERFHAGHGPNRHPNCPVCSEVDCTYTLAQVREMGWVPPGTASEIRSETERLRAALVEIADYADAPGRSVLALMAKEALGA